MTTAILHHSREQDLLREYRTRLVAEVVTGKLDVRAAAKDLPEELAARLPDEASLDSAEDDADLSEDTEPNEEA